MLNSRAILLSRLVANSLRTRAANTQVVRNGHHWHYRQGPEHFPKSVTYGSLAISGAMWWWVLWHFYHEPEHVFGEYEYPDTSKWTDKELGIPPDDVDDE